MRVFAKLQLQLFRPVDPASLGFFRIIFGLLGFADVLNTYIYYHLRVKAFDPDRFQFYYYGFEWVTAFREPFMSIFFIAMMLAALAITIGYRYRMAALFFAIGFTYLFLLEKAFYLNHGYLFCWISWVMVFCPADAIYSVSQRKRSEGGVSWIPYWPLFLLRFLMGVVYFFGGIAKISADWVQAIPLKQWLASKEEMPVVGPLIADEFTAYFMSYGGLLLFLTFFFFLMNRRTRRWAFGVAIFFHLMNALIFNIGVFPYLSLALTALFFPPDFPRRLLRWIGIRSPKLKTTEADAITPTGKKCVSYATAVLIGIHLLLPLRHHLFPGSVAWTEEGHRYSRRMMLRSKYGYGRFVVEDLHTGEKEKIDPRKYLGAKQHRKLFAHPDMVLQFAHFLKGKYARAGRQVAVYADVRVSLNSRKLQTFIDPTVDLGTKQWKFFEHSDWIVPFE